MNNSNYKQYNQVQIKTANKGKLIVMLYQGAIKFMKKALLLMEKKDMEGKGNCLIRSQDIILELLYALDQKMLDSGNDLALNLQRLYLFSYRQLVQANVQMDPKPIKDVIGIMENLLEAWENVISAEGKDSEPSSAATGVAFTG